MEITVGPDGIILSAAQMQLCRDMAVACILCKYKNEFNDILNGKISTMLSNINQQIAMENP